MKSFLRELENVENLDLLIDMFTKRVTERVAEKRKTFESKREGRHTESGGLFVLDTTPPVSDEELSASAREAVFSFPEQELCSLDIDATNCFHALSR